MLLCLCLGALALRWTSLCRGDTCVYNDLDEWESPQMVNDHSALGLCVSRFHLKETAAYQIAALQKALDDSVPLSELERANRQYTELTIKYRDVLQRDSCLIQRSTNLQHLQVSI